MKPTLNKLVFMYPKIYNYFIDMKVILIILMLFMSSCNKNSEVKTVTTVSAEKAIEIMNDSEGFVIVDVRTIEEYESGHIENAINIPVETIEDRPAQLDDLDQLILVYCRSGRRSLEAANKLVQLGYTNVIDFGGVIDWPKDLVKD